MLVADPEDKLLLITLIGFGDSELLDRKPIGYLFSCLFADEHRLRVTGDVANFPGGENFVFADISFFVSEIQHYLFARKTIYNVAEQVSACFFV